MPSGEGVRSRHQLMADSMSVMCRAATALARRGGEDSAAARPDRPAGGLDTESQGALAGAGAGVGAGAGWITITAPGVVVDVSLIMPPPSTLPEPVTFWFGLSGPTMRATQSARSF